MKKKNIKTIVIIAIAVGLVSWKLVDNKNQMDEQAELSMRTNTHIPVKVSKVGSQQIDNSFIVDGILKAQDEVVVYSKTQGIVTKKYKRAGDYVSRGTVIAQIENNVESETLGLAEQNLSKAQKDVERYKRLADAGAVTQREYEDALLTYREAQRIITNLKEQLRNTTIVSPLNGILDKDYFEEGTLLSPGAQVADIIDAKKLKLVVNVTERDVFRLTKGQSVQMTTDIYPNEVFEGVIDVISSRGNDALSYQVEIPIKGENAKLLKHGMYASAKFSTNLESTIDQLVVNKKAIIESLKNPEVYVVKGDKAYRTSISIGKTNNEFVEVTQGLSLNDQVVVSGQINLRDGLQVEIVQ